MNWSRSRGKKVARVASAERSGRAAPAVAREGKRADPAELVVVAANEYIVSHYPVGLLAGTPRRLGLGGRELWIVPIVLTSPGYGAVGEVGLVALETGERKVVGSTPRSEVVAEIQRLREEKHEQLEAAFHRARTV
jgi:hypothetical protein